MAKPMRKGPPAPARYDGFDKMPLNGKWRAGKSGRVAEDRDPYSNELLVKRNTRYPKPAVAVAFADVARIERHKEGGFNVAKAIAIGVESGAGAMVTLILFAMQID